MAIAISKKPIVQVHALSKIYSGVGTPSTEALRNINLDVNEGEIVCIVGKSGCGKTTLLNIIAGILESTSGSVSVFGEPPFKAHSQISYMPQGAKLLPYRNVLQNAAISLELQNTLTPETVQKLTELLDFLGLAEFLNYYPKELSGGMQQRVVLARTLAVDASLLLCDEPFISLDFNTRLELEDLLWQTVKTENKTCVFITHDIESAVALGDQIVVMSPRPGSIWCSIDMNAEIARTSPVVRRRLPLFSHYFSEVWQALRESEDSNDKT